MRWPGAPFLRRFFDRLGVTCGGCAGNEDVAREALPSDLVRVTRHIKNFSEWKMFLELAYGVGA